MEDEIKGMKWNKRKWMKESEIKAKSSMNYCSLLGQQMWKRALQSHFIFTQAKDHCHWLPGHPWCLITLCEHTPLVSYPLREGNSFHIKYHKKMDNQTLENCSYLSHLTLCINTVAWQGRALEQGQKGSSLWSHAPDSISSRQVSKPLPGKAGGWAPRVWHGLLSHPGFPDRMEEQFSPSCQDLTPAAAPLLC